jgi:hypothetical protein
MTVHATLPGVNSRMPTELKLQPKVSHQANEGVGLVCTIGRVDTTGAGASRMDQPIEHTGVRRIDLNNNMIGNG